MRYLALASGQPGAAGAHVDRAERRAATLPALPRELWAPSLSALVGRAAIVAMYRPADAVPRSEPPAAPAVADPAAEGLERAATHGDKHVIKFTDTAAEVYTRTGM